MLHCLNTSGGTTTCSDMTVLERQRARNCFSSSALGEVVAHSMKPDPGFENGWPEFGSPGGSGSAISRACSTGKETFRKRKLAQPQNPNHDKRIKASLDEGESKSKSKITEQKTTPKSINGNKNKRETITTSENSKGSEVQNQKPDFIHVRARRGQATDSHSLAERVRREKISERMKYLQDLVPGCNKIAGKAGMLDEIINYVQSLQRQVEFLSMKLAAVNPRLDFNIDDLFTKEVFPQSCFPTIGMQSEISNSTYLQFNSAAQQLVSCGTGGLINNMGLITPLSLPEMFLDSSSSFTQQHILPSSTIWEGDFQSLHSVAFDQVQGRSTSFPSQPFTGLLEGSNLKMEM